MGVVLASELRSWESSFSAEGTSAMLCKLVLWRSESPPLIWAFSSPMRATLCARFLELAGGPSLEFVRWSAICRKVSLLTADALRTWCGVQSGATLAVRIRWGGMTTSWITILLKDVSLSTLAAPALALRGDVVDMEDVNRERNSDAREGIGQNGETFCSVKVDKRRERQDTGRIEAVSRQRQLALAVAIILI